MDPNITIAEIRRLYTEILTGADHFTTDAYQLAEHISTLDDWLSKGGFKPEVWNV